MGILPPSLQASGEVMINGRRFQLPQDTAQLRRLWGNTLASLPQEPWLSLDPTMAIQQQVAEGHRFVRGLPPAALQRRSRICSSLVWRGGTALSVAAFRRHGTARRVCGSPCRWRADSDCR